MTVVSLLITGRKASITGLWMQPVSRESRRPDQLQVRENSLRRDLAWVSHAQREGKGEGEGKGDEVGPADWNTCSPFASQQAPPQSLYFKQSLRHNGQCLGAWATPIK